MAKEYRVTPMIRRVNKLTSWLARKGRGPSEVLTTTGRKSGEPRSVPITPITCGSVEYIVSPYGERHWVKNVRHNPSVTLERGGRRRSAQLVEVTGEVTEVVKAYYEKESFARKYMDVPDAPALDDFIETADRFPVFRVETT